MTQGEVFESVLTAAQAGEEWAFSRLYTDFNPRVERYFASRAPQAADDLAAETWMGVARRLKSFEGDENQFRAWLFTIAHRRLLDHWTAQNRRSEEPLDALHLHEDDQPTDHTKHLASVEDLAEDVVNTAAARAAAQRIARILNRDQAEVILLRLLGGLEVDQVAEILGKRPGTVRVLQHRALKKLAEEISLEDVTG
jgi:RNA polymerase sigma-70 factor, ECF subfamily